jgi:hypothetical protein
VLEMLELTGPGKAVSTVLFYLRWPYTAVRDLVVKSLARPLPPNQSEEAVCSAALAAWLDGLQAEALRRAGSHPVWKQIAHSFDAGLKGQAHDRFAHVFRNFELKETDQLDEAAKAIPEKLANSPALLNTYRLGVVGVDLAAVGGTLAAVWPPTVYHLLLVPVVLGLTRQGVELGVRSAVDRGRNRLRSHREGLVAEHLSGPLAGWLADAPVSGGSSLERLQQVLRRVPAAIRELAAVVRPGVPQPAAA